MERNEERERKIKKVDRLRDSKLYRSVSVVFSDGAGSIQFRNERDRANLSNVATSCLVLEPSAIVVYRTEDDVTHNIPASEMIQIAMQVMAQKQAVTTASWIHKDALALLNTREEIEAYHITTGWPDLLTFNR